MPLRTFDIEEQRKNLKIGPAVQWGRGETTNDPGRHPLNASNRVHKARMVMWSEPDPAPLKPGATIFTMGSCFAREIENGLEARGFDIASYIPGTFDEVGREGRTEVALTNRYNTPSMLLEMRRLLEGAGIVPDDALISTDSRGRSFDAHYNATIHEIDDLLERRARFHAHFQRIREADALFFTLGLNEAAYDTEAGLYRNVSPTVNEIRAGRPLEVHSFTVAENVAQLEQIRALIRTHCVKSPRIFITVSPVPLTLTHQDCDVIVANTEGKSILRAAVAEICARHDDVTYFPSYEMATTADPAGVFKGDKRHINPKFVRQIITTFVKRHVEGGGDEGADDAAELAETA